MDRRDLYDAMFRALTDVIAGEKDRNDARYAYYQVMSHRNWSNPEFAQVVEDAMSLFDATESRYGRHQTLGDVVYDVATQWVALDLGAFVLADRTLSERITREAYDEARRNADDRSAILRQFESARRGGYRDDRGGGRPDGRSEGRPDGRDDSRGRGFERSREPIFRERSEQSRGRGTMMGGMSSSYRERPQAQATPVEPQRREEVAAPRPMAQPKPSRLDGPDFTSARPYDEFTIDGEIWRPAHKSGWKVAQTPDRPFETVYNIHEKLRFHVRGEDGTVREEFLDMNRDNNYLRHELMAEQRHPYKEEAPVFNRDGLVAHDAPAAQQRNTRVAKALRLPMEVSDDIRAVASMEEADCLTMFEQSRRSGQQFVSVVAKLTPAVFTSQTYSSANEWLKSLTASVNLTDASEKLMESERTIDPILWGVVNKRFSTMVSDAVEHEFGVGVRITDFSKDYPKLIDHLKKVRGEAWARQFSQVARGLIDKVLARMEGDAAKDYLGATLGLSDDQLITYEPTAVVFEDFFLIAPLDASVNDLGILLNGKSQIVDSDTHPELHKFLGTLFRKRDEKEEAASVYMLTNDGVRIQVLRNPLDEGTYMVRSL